MGRSDGVLILALVGALAAGGCLSSAPVPGGGGEAAPETLGSMTLTSELLGNATLAPASCSSGAREYFLGGDFEDEKAGMVIRLAVDPVTGPAVRVFDPAEPFRRTVVFRQADCPVFHFSLDSTGWRVNKVEDFRLVIDVDCVGPAGDRLRGRVSSTHCF